MQRPYTWTRFARQIAIAALVFTALNLVAYWTSGYFAREREYHQVVEDIVNHPQVQTVFAGDSHVAHPLNDYLNDDPGATAYSVATGGDSLRECFAKLRYVLDHVSQVTTIVITADPHMFGEGRLASANRVFADKYFVAARDGSGLSDGWLSALLGQVPLFNDDFMQYLRTLISTKLSGARQSEHAEGGPSWGDLPEAQRSAIARETGVGDHAHLGDFPQPFVWYERILDLARSRSVRVIGVRYPVHPQYSAQAHLDQVAFINQRLRAAGLVEIVDLHDAIVDPRDFDDPDHLTEDAAPLLLHALQDGIRGAPLQLVRSNASGRVQPSLHRH